MESSSSTASSLTSKAPEISNPSIISSCSIATSPSVVDPPPVVFGETSAPHTDVPLEPMEDSMDARLGSGSAALLDYIKSPGFAACSSSSPFAYAVGTGSCAPIQNSSDFATFAGLPECPRPKLLGYSGAPHMDLPTEKPLEGVTHIQACLLSLINVLKISSFQDLMDGANRKLWLALIELIGEKCCHKPVYDDGMMVRSNYRNVEFLTDLDVLKYIKERNQILVRFLCGLSGVDFENASSKTRYAFGQTVEQVYYLRNLNLILPLSFTANLIQSCISGSKAVSLVNGKTSPGGSYTSYKDWITKEGSKQLATLPGTIEYWFDNIGKYIIKNYRVNAEKTKTADIISICIQVAFKDQLNLQKDRALMPKTVELTELKTIHEKMEAEIEKGNDNFRNYRWNFLV